MFFLLLWIFPLGLELTSIPMYWNGSRITQLDLLIFAFSAPNVALGAWMPAQAAFGKASP